MYLGILGAGSWGTAMAILWARHGHKVRLWGRSETTIADYRAAGRNLRFLPDAPFPPGLTLSADLKQTVQDNSLLALAVPLQAYRGLLSGMLPLLTPHHRLILLSKGMELDTHKLPSQIATHVLGPDWADRVFPLSGPSFAKEVAQNQPTTVVLGGRQEQSLRELQNALNCPSFRMYRNLDVVGIELAGALKNVIAIASGITSGLGLGHNTRAGLITRGLSEISRLGVALGARRETFSGLAGLGDLVLTCTGDLSRNLQVGMALGKGDSLERVLNQLGMVAEGVHTCRAAKKLAAELKVEVPITSAVNSILYEGLSPRAALTALMTRSLKPETQAYQSLY